MPDNALPILGSWSSLDSLLASQRERLGAVVERARKAPFYRQRLTGQFDGLPTTTKANLREASPFGFLAVPRKRLATYHESSGTSGEPTSSYFTDEDWEDVVTRFNRNALNLSVEDVVLVKTPYSMVTTAHQMHLAARQKDAMVVPADNRSTNMPYSRVVGLLKRLPITVAWCLPTEVLLWAKAARLNDLDPTRSFPNLRAFAVAGEPTTKAKRQRLEALWGGKKVFEDYGSTETGSLAGECPHGRLHLWADRLYFEVWDGNRFTERGTGRLIVTTLHREAMPLVRYDLEDIVEISHEDCPCDWKLPTIEVFGRSAANQAARDVETAVYSLPIRYGVLFWRAREGRIEIEAASGFEKDASEELEARTGLKVAIAQELVPRERLTQPMTFQKPRYWFGKNEDWNQFYY